MTQLEYALPDTAHQGESNGVKDALGKWSYCSLVVWFDRSTSDNFVAALHMILHMPYTDEGLGLVFLFLTAKKQEDQHIN